MIMVQHVKMSRHHKNVDWAINTNYTNTYLNKLRIDFLYKEVHTIQMNINITLYGMVSCTDDAHVTHVWSLKEMCLHG